LRLNSFFLSGDMLCRAWNTQDGYARDLKAFLNFLWHNRNRVSWRDTTTADHLAYLVWRRKDPAGPRIDDATWDREVSAVNRFYCVSTSIAPICLWLSIGDCAKRMRPTVEQVRRLARRGVSRTTPPNTPPRSRTPTSTSTP
jgi:hypothetical protein